MAPLVAREGPGLHCLKGHSRRGSLTAARIHGTIGALFDALRREEVVVMENRGSSVP